MEILMRSSGRFLLWLPGLMLLAGCVATPERAPQRKAGVQPPVIVTRAEWGAKPPVAAMKEQQPQQITIHHTATPQKPERTLEQKLQGLQQFSQSEGKLASGKTKPPWPDVPYHYYIDVSGRVGEGREVKFVGDTNTEYDPTGHALVVLEGNFEVEQPTPAQMESLKKTLAWLAARYGVKPAQIQAHNDFAQTLCPGKNLKALLPELRAAVEE
jgi:hypothetical protein